MPTLREIRLDFEANKASVRRATTEWLRTRPEAVQKLGERFPAWHLYQIAGCSDHETCEQHAYLRDAVVCLYSYFEDGETVSVRVLHCPTEPERGVERFVCPVRLLRWVRITESDEIVPMCRCSPGNVEHNPGCAAGMEIEREFRSREVPA